MTKLHPPLSIDAALARIAGQLERGWDEMAEVTSRKVGLVRAWGNPTRREHIPVKDAIRLDVAYRAAGGAGAPLFETYGLQLDAAGVDWFADQIALAHHAATLIKECSEAEIAVVMASQPGSSPRDRAYALREVEQAIAVLARARTMLIGATRPWPADTDPPSTGPPVWPDRLVP